MHTPKTLHLHLHHTNCMEGPGGFPSTFLSAPPCACGSLRRLSSPSCLQETCVTKVSYECVCLFLPTHTDINVQPFRQRHTHRGFCFVLQKQEHDTCFSEIRFSLLTNSDTTAGCVSILLSVGSSSTSVVSSALDTRGVARAWSPRSRLRSMF